MVLTNSQYEQLMSAYYARQLRTKDIMDERHQEIAARIPEMESLDAQIRELSLAFAKEKLSGRSTSTDLDKQIQAITVKKEKLLEKHGFPVDYTPAKTAKIPDISGTRNVTVLKMPL